MIRLLRTSTAALLVLGVLSACSPACGAGAASGEAAVAGLISAARDAQSPTDVCTFVANGYTVSEQELADLKQRYADRPDDALTSTLSGQLGSTAQVTVTDGDFTDVFQVKFDSDTRWTVAFGTLFG